MVNVYFLREDATTPDGHTEIDVAYRERLILGGGTPLNTGGALTHNHSVTSDDNSHTSAVTSAAASGSVVSVDRILSGTTHNHNVTANSTAVNHMPSYKTFRCVYRDTSGWGGSNKSGNISFCETVPSGYSRIENGQSYFIFISGTAGSTGGNAGNIPGHTINGSLSAYPDTCVKNSFDFAFVSPANHTHTYSTTTDTHPNDYSYWSCGLIKASSDTTIKQNMICLFDGDPGAGWTLVNTTDKYFRISSTNSITTGGTYLAYSHSHSGNNITTSGSGQQGIGSTISGWVMITANHTHLCWYTTDTVSMQPIYVKLLLYSADHDFGSTATRSIFVTTC